ncbi:MAG TPA: hypothetical protein PK231_11885, partial [Acidocella sp.]|nr:hypothetical protein [Acidocella sp.]
MNDHGAGGGGFNRLGLCTSSHGKGTCQSGYGSQKKFTHEENLPEKPDARPELKQPIVTRPKI